MSATGAKLGHHKFHTGRGGIGESNLSQGEADITTFQ